MGRQRDKVVRSPLSVERTSFVGRHHELAELRRLLGASRLVTLVGVGGVGKTRLALRAATDLQRFFPDGVAVVELAAARDPALVGTEVAAALHVQDAPGGWVAGRIAEVVSDRRLLLVLDNCEHLSDAVGVLVDALLRWCPRLHILATSRRALDVDGEVVFRVSPLPVPTTAPESGDVLAYDSVRLLLDRAGSFAPDAGPAGREREQVAELCRRLDGLPLAIEMAAARLCTLTPRQVTDRLDHRLRLLRRSGPVVPERHRTLSATIRWSHDLLTPTEQTVWRRACVFAGEFDVVAAEAVCSDASLAADTVLEALSGLLAASLLEVVRGEDAPRFRMLETVRSYGRERLEEAGETARCLRRHVDWCAATVAAASPEFIGPRQAEVFDALESVHAELGAALGHCVRTPELRGTGLRMVADLWLYWEARGHLAQARRLLRALLQGCPTGTADHRRGLAVAGFLELSASQAQAAVPLLDEALDLAQAAGDRAVTAFAHQYRGLAAMFLGDLAAAGALLRRASDEYCRLDPRYAAFCLADLGVVAVLQGHLDEAAAAFADSLRLNEGGDPWTRSHALWGASLVPLLQGDAPAATDVARQALQLMRQVGDRSGVALCLDSLSWSAAARDTQLAARLAGAADAVWRSIPADPPGPVEALRQRFAQPARRAAGEAEWTRGFDEGATLDRPHALALALGETPPEPAPGPTATAREQPLTGRQREVASLVAEGLTDRQIAERLVISPRTAESHVQQILTRLGVRSRAQVAAWVAGRPA